MPTPKKPATNSRITKPAHPSAPARPPAKPQPQPQPQPPAKPQPKTPKLYLGPPRSPEEPLWCGVRIPIIGLCGEPLSGKTTFALNIAPSETVVIDPELSAETYIHSDANPAGIEVASYLRVPDLVAEATGSFTHYGLFTWFSAWVKALEAGAYRVALFENIALLEDGITEYVERNPQKFGLKGGQATTTLKWGPVKRVETQLLLALAAKVETVVFTTHMGAIYEGGQPTKRKRAKAKEPAYDFTTLFLRLDRSPDRAGNVPLKPVALQAYKDRLMARVGTDEYGEPVFRPYLPPRIPDCTPGKIRFYLLNPPDYSNLSDDEKELPTTFSEQDLLEMRMVTSANEVRTQELALERESVRARVTIASKNAASAYPAEPGEEEEEETTEEATTHEEEVSDETASSETEEEKGDETEQGEATEATAELDSESIGSKGAITPPQLAELMALRYEAAEEADLSDDQWAKILARRGVKLPTELTADQATEIIDAFVANLGIDEERKDELITKHEAKFRKALRAYEAKHVPF